MNPTEYRIEQKRMIKAEAEKLGFCFSGFTDVSPINDFQPFLTWLEKEQYGQMSWIARADSIEKRQNPQLIFPEAKTILVLGILLERFSGERFAVANFAHYYDYHDQIKSLSETLMRNVNQLAKEPAIFRICTDAAPVMETALAVRAGLGWVGKNSMLIHPEVGSFTLLTEIFLSWKLEPDEPYRREHCGKCRACVDACPTQCIDPLSRTIDASKCISYLTIEHRGEIPSELAPACGNHIFGCDVCAAVCPWNARQGKSLSPLKRCDHLFAFEHDAQLSDEEFREKYKGTPFARLKAERFRRNVANALNFSQKEKNDPR